MKQDDRIRLQHMRDSAQEVIQFTANRQRSDLDSDLMLLRALSMSVGIIGEAASRISSDYREAHPEVPWGSIIGMRNFVFHVYFKVDPDILWDTAAVSVPELLAQIETLLEESSD
jgi:uncharacterized protein with HEPN domain